MTLLTNWALSALAFWLTALVLPGFKVKGLWGALVVAALFGMVHFFVGWLLFVLIGLGTLGLGFLFAFITRWLVDAIVLKLIDVMTDKLEVKSFGWAFLGAMLMSGLGTLAEYLLSTQAQGPSEIRV